MTEEHRREIAIPGGTVRLTEEATKREGPSPDLQRRTLPLAEQAIEDHQARERAGKFNSDELLRRQGEKEIEEFRSQQLRLWKARGGTAEEFRAEWPRIKADHIHRDNGERLRNSRSVYD